MTSEAAPKTSPFWLEDAPALEESFTGELPAQADAVVIGAGLTGLSAARTLAARGKRVVALDAGAPGGGASCRSGGMVGGGHRLSSEKLSAQYGADLARRLLHEAHLDSAAFIRRLIKEEDIACDFAESGRLRGMWTRADYDAAGRELDRLRRILPLEAEMLPKARLAQEVATDLYAGGVLFPRHGGLNPAKYTAGLLQAARRAGALVFGHTPAVAVTAHRGAIVVKTPRGALRAGRALLATNGYASPFMRYHRRRVFGVPSFIVATAPLKNSADELIPGRRMVVETRRRHCYYRASPDGKRLIFGARAAMHNAVSEPFARRQLTALIGEIFPSLAQIGISHSWRGNTGFSFDLLPNIGQSEKNLWHAMGYCGNGNTIAPWLGHKAALTMLGDSAGESAFQHTAFSTRWWHRGTPWFLIPADGILRIADWRDYRRRATERAPFDF